jgi:hypothetical protein
MAAIRRLAPSTGGMHRAGRLPKKRSIEMLRTITAWISILVAALAARPQAAAAEAAKITRTPEGFAIASPVYRATISGTSGLLGPMTIDGCTVIEKMHIDLSDRPLGKVEVVVEGGAKVVAYIAAPQDKGSNKIVERALRITYEAQDQSTLLVKVLATVGKEVAGRGPVFTLGGEAQMVRSLEFKETIPVPVLQGRSPWMRVKYHYANGATLGILNQGAGNPYNPNENGGVEKLTYGRGGYVPNSEYVYTLIAQRGARRALGAPPMTVVEAATPAVFWQGDRIQATLRIKQEHCRKLAGLAGLRVKHEVQDAFERVVARGEMPLDLSGTADPREIKVPLAVGKLGWFRAYFTVNDAAGSLLEGRERLIFAVLKHQPGMGEKFDNQLQTDYTIGLGLLRSGVNPANVAEAAGNVARNVQEARGTDVNVSYAIDGSPVGNDPRRFGEVCFQLFQQVKDGIPRVEIINEPNGTLQPKEYVDTFLRPAYENIHRASPGTKVLAPVLCGIGPEQARYLEDLYKLGLKGLTDELTFHPYAGNFDDGDAVPSMQRLAAIIAANGDAGKPVHFTEAGYFHGGWSNLPALREIVKLAVSQYAWQNAVLGIDHRHNFYYFTDIMGYYDMWLRANQLTPAAVALRTYTGFVKSQGRAQRLDFGSLEAVRAFRFPGGQRQVIVLWNAGNWVPAGSPDPVTPVAFATDAARVDLYDCFGNPLPAAARQGKLRLEVGTYPCYLIADARARLDPVPEKWGVNVALASLGAAAEASAEEGVHPAVSAIDGNTATGSSWRSLVPNELPQSLTVTLAGPATVDRVGLWGYGPRGYDLAARRPDGTWLKLVSRRDQPYRRFRSESFPPLLTDQLRLTVVDSTTDRAEVAELQIFSPSAAIGKAAELVNWALKQNGATARASSEMKKEVTVAEQDWGAKQPRISKVLLHGKAENAIDGKRLIGHWKDFFPTTWVAAAGQPLPQWLEVDLAAPHKISSITVYTIAFAGWTPENSGIRAWDVQVWDGQDWQTVESVTGNVRVSKTTRLAKPLVTGKIRILVKATNDPQGTVGIMEVEAYGPK